MKSTNIFGQKIIKKISMLMVAALFISGFFAITANAIITNLTLTSPITDVDWSGTQNITWTYTDDGTLGPINILLSSDSGANYNNLVTGVDVAGSPYTWDTTGTVDGTKYRIKVIDSATSIAFESPVDFTVDNTAPIFTVTDGTDAGPVQTDTINITTAETVPSDESGIASQEYGFSSDGVCDNSYGNSFTSAVDFTIAGDHTDYLCVKATDNAGNIGYELVGQLNTDNTAPTVVLTSTSLNSTDFTKDSLIPMTATFNEPVTGFVVADIRVGNGAANNFLGSSTTYTFDVTPTADGLVTVDIAGSVAQDIALNDNTIATQFSLTYDTTNPVISNFTSPVEATVYTSSVPLIFTASDANLNTCSYTINDGDAVDVTCGSGAQFNENVTGMIDGRNELVLTVTDLAGNSVSSSAVSFVYNNDGILTVDDTVNNNVDFTTIQEAIDKATAGNTIQVAEGTYAESVVVDKNLTLMGAKANVDPRNGDWSGDISIVNANGNDCGIEIAADDVVINGFKIINSTGSGTGKSGGVCMINGNNPTIKYNYLSGNKFAGIQLYVSGEHSIQGGSILYNEVINAANYGIYIGSATNVESTISGITVQYNDVHQNGKYGLQLISHNIKNAVTDLNIFDNKFYSNTRNGLKLVDATNNQIKRNKIYENGGGGTSDKYKYGVMIEAQVGNDGVVTGNNFENNEFYSNVSGSIIVIDNYVVGADFTGTQFIDNKFEEDNGNYGINNTTDSTLIATPNWWGTAVKGTIEGMLSGGVNFEPYYVNAEMTILSNVAVVETFVDDNYSDGSADTHIFGYDAFDAIQDGIDAVSSAGTVNVADGSYNELINLTKDNLTLRSVGGALSTTITGTAGTNEEAALVRFSADGCTIDGFTLDHENSTETTARIIGAKDFDGTVVENCILQNSLRAFGGDWYGKPTNITFNGNTFDNVLRGLSNTEDIVDMKVTNNTFTNVGNGIRLARVSGTVEVTGNVFTDVVDGYYYKVTAGSSVNDYPSLADVFENNTFLQNASFEDVEGGSFVEGIFATITEAIEDSEAGATINVVAGTYTEDVLIDKALILNGANANVSYGTGRGAESILQPFTAGWHAIGFGVGAGTDHVTINGFEITATGSENAIVCGKYGPSYLDIKFNYIHHVGTDRGSQNVHGIWYGGGPDDQTNVNISDNYFNEILNHNVSTNGKGSSAAIWFGQSNGQGTISNVTIERNVINNVRSNLDTKDFESSTYSDVGKITASGIYFGIGWRSDTYTGNVAGAIINGNTIANVIGGMAYGIQLSGSTPNIDISNNEIADISSPNGISYAYAIGVPSTNTGTGITINKNSLTNATVGVINGRVSNQIDAEKNWWGDKTGPLHATLNTSGLGSSVIDDVDFSPFCTNAGCTTFASVDAIASFDLVFNPTSALVNTNSGLTVTAKDILKYLVVNDTTTKVSLTGDNGSSFGVALLTMEADGDTGTTVTNSVTGTVNVTATEVGGASVGTGQVTFINSDTVGPNIISHTPNDGVTEVSINVVPYLDFNESLKVTTVSSANIQLYKYDNDSEIAATVALVEGSTRVTITPLSPLDYDTQYYLTASASVTDTTGNALTTVYNSSTKGSHEFKTVADTADQTAPTISSHFPVDAETGISVNVDPYLIFSEALKASTVNSTNIQLKKYIGGLTVAATISLVEGGTRVIITPDSVLDTDIQYYFAVCTSVQDEAGNALAVALDDGNKNSHEFRTALDTSDHTAPVIASHTPDNGATNIVVTVAPYIIFSEALKASTVNSTNIQLKEYSNDLMVSATVSLVEGGTRVNITPDSSLANDTQYYFAVSTAVQDEAGNALAVVLDDGTKGSHEFTTVAVQAIVVDEIIAQNNSATANDTYLSGWHYTYRITVNTDETDLSVKFADWVNSVNSEQKVLANGNMRLLFNTETGNGLGSVVGLAESDIVNGVGTIGSFVIGKDYSDQDPDVIDISSFDISTDPGRQIKFDVFTKIPVDTASGFYTTDYGIKVESVEQ